MQGFLKYPHLERFGSPDVDGIEVGPCLVFPKLDGTNASVWAHVEDGGPVGEFTVLHAGSRRRELTEDSDNFGFAAWVRTQDHCMGPLGRFYQHPHRARYRLFGEWLVPHTFKGYRDEAWKRFWIFDVYDNVEERFLTYDEYEPMVDDAGLAYVPPIASIINPTEEQLRRIAESNHFLCKEGEGPGEGIVIKRYDFRNRYGRTTWAKIVRNEFKDANLTTFGAPEKGETFQVEVAIARDVVTPALVAKERAKVESALIQENATLPSASEDCKAHRKWLLHSLRGKLIPRLLETVYHCVVTEELWPQLKKYKDPAVDFKKLRKHVFAATKSCASDLF